jgi:hypothetical protein
MNKNHSQGAGQNYGRFSIIPLLAQNNMLL